MRSNATVVSGQVLRIAALALSALGFSVAPGGTAQKEAASASPGAAYLQRGEAVEASFSEFSRRLERAHARLAELLRATAPQLYEGLEEQPPRKLQSGYQILPEILPDSPPPAKSAQDFFHAYSWPRTENLLEERSRRLAELTQGIETTASSNDVEAFAQLVSDYRVLKKDHAWIEDHIRHNRLWQGQIAVRPEIFRRGTILYNLARERQEILDQLADDPAADPVLRNRERILLEQIRKGPSRTWSPAYVRARKQRSGEWEVSALLYSDVEDEAFLRQFRKIIESYWRYEDDEVRFQLTLSIQLIPAARLYGGDLEGRNSELQASTVPAPGERLDLNRHLGLFPSDGAALTTGAEKIHTRGRFILLGPEAVGPRTLAHEFGHVLGFRDEYVRGYRDLGVDGYEILEASPDPDDLMCSSGTGAVLKRHFEELISR